MSSAALKFFVVSFLAFLQMANISFAQHTSFPIDEWIKKLSAEKDVNCENFRAIYRQLYNSDSTVAYPVYKELEKREASANLFFKARFHCIMGTEESRHYYSGAKQQVKVLFEQALKEASVTGDSDLVSYISWQYGAKMYKYQEVELAATYCLNAVETNNRFLYTTNGYMSASVLGEVLFHCREYEKCIYYSGWSMANWPDTSIYKDNFFTKIYNTIGQAYQRLNMPDSAMVNYKRSMAYAGKTNNELWKAINSGYEAQILFLRKEYEKAKPLFAYDYSITRKADLNIAASSLEWMARINLIEGKKDSALLQTKQALQLLSVSDSFFLQKNNFLQNTYYTIADIYRSMGKTDSFSRYFQLYTTLHDSLERVIARSSFDISSMRNANEKRFYTIQAIQREKQSQVQQRNLMMIAILFLSAVVILVINRQRLRLKYKQELATQEKRRVEQEMESARAQLQLFTQNIIEKTSLIEQLEHRVQDKTASLESQRVITELSNKTILTEEDWDKFKTLFEKIFPLFFQRLKSKANDITMAEQRMAALTRLQLTGRQMASMLGISVDSVHKTRQRLRKRFDIGSDANLEEYIGDI